MRNIISKIAAQLGLVITFIAVLLTQSSGHQKLIRRFVALVI
jgi:hypothetical protein